MHWVSLVLHSSLILGSFCKNVNDDRKGRLFGYGYSYTMTVAEPYVITSLVPSSCVQVDATLPPCRKVRNFNSFPGLRGWATTNSTNTAQNMTIQARNATTNSSASGTQSTPLSWGEYLGFAAPTVTVTSTFLQTTTVSDPGVLVTFSVRGCRPLRLPMDLERCPISTPLPAPVIVPTATVTITQSLQPTLLSNGTSFNVENSNVVQGTETEASIAEQSKQPTQALSGVNTTS